MALFIEGGNPPIIHSFVKNTAYVIDVTYGKYPLFSQQKQGRLVSFHAETSVSETGLSIPMTGIFEVTTQGGACYTQAVDLCSDHTSGHAKALMMRRLRNEKEPYELLPEQIEHCVSSNSVTRTHVNSISDCVIQADPLIQAHQTQDLQLGERTLTEEAITRLTSQPYSLLNIVDDASGYKIEHPIFGSDCNIEVLAERPAARYLPKLQNELTSYNEKVRENQNQTHLGGRSKN